MQAGGNFVDILKKFIILGCGFGCGFGCDLVLKSKLVANAQRYFGAFELPKSLSQVASMPCLAISIV